MAISSIPPVENVLKDLKSLILSAPKNITAQELFQDYFEVTQTKLNPRHYNYKNEDAFLGDYPQFFYAVNIIRGQIHYAGISSNPSTNAVAKLVNNQRNGGKKSNICVNGTKDAYNYNNEPNFETPKKNNEVVDPSKPSYADFFKTPQRNTFDEQPSYEPSVTISKGSDVLSTAKLARSHSVKLRRKPSTMRAIIPPPPRHPPLHKKMHNLRIIHTSASNTAFKGGDLRSIIEKNKTFNDKLKVVEKTPPHTLKNQQNMNKSLMYAHIMNERIMNPERENGNGKIGGGSIVNNKKVNNSNGHNNYNAPKNNNTTPEVPKRITTTVNNANGIQQSKPVLSVADENKELNDFVIALRANVNRCLNLHVDKFCSLSQLQKDYINLFNEPFHPPDMPRNDITDIFETYLDKVCMVLCNMAGVLYIKGVINDFE